MSDLLLRLGERAVGTRPRVQPLLRPGREVAAAFPDEAAGRSSLAEEQTQDQPPIGSPAPQTADRHEANPPTPSLPRATDAPATGMRALPSAEPTRHDQAADRPMNLRQAIERIFLSEPAGTAAPGALPRPTAEVSAQRPVQPPSPEESPREASLPYFFDPPAPAGRERQVASNGSPEPYATALPPQSPTLHEASRRSQPAAEIQVTIGRIEIHAAAPPPAIQARPRPSGPTGLTLGDYLSQRSEGRA